jgi:hypothetical protein
MLVHARLVRTNAQVWALRLNELANEVLCRVALDRDYATEAIVLFDHFLGDHRAAPTSAVNVHDLVLSVLAYLVRKEACHVVLIGRSNSKVDSRVDGRALDDLAHLMKQATALALGRFDP